MATPPSRPPMSKGSVALLSTSALAFGAYIFTRSRARGARLVQPEEQGRFQGQGQTDAAAGEIARGKDIPRSGGETVSSVSRSSSRAARMASRAAGARGREIWELETGRGGGGDGC